MGRCRCGSEAPSLVAPIAEMICVVQGDGTLRDGLQAQSMTLWSAVSGSTWRPLLPHLSAMLVCSAAYPTPVTRPTSREMHFSPSDHLWRANASWKTEAALYCD